MVIFLSMLVDFPLCGLHRCRQPVRASSKGNAVVTFECCSQIIGRELFLETERSRIGDLRAWQSQLSFDKLSPRRRARTRKNGVKKFAQGSIA
jgi:hypothetical protein